mmetsp:Transcript_4539/g.11691  ORF Transcript_4539/g.11691 Transcript_4539/m.11691 type:complete len:130 (+) Transcript_4539:83-472(+)
MPTIPFFLRTMQRIPNTGLTLFDACCCTNTYIFTDTPGCIGCQCNGKLLCVEGACCLKQNVPKMACLCCEVNAGDLNTCIKGQVQVLCCVNECSCPPGQDTAIQFAKLGIVCYPTFGICKPQLQIQLRV